MTSCFVNKKAETTFKTRANASVSECKEFDYIVDIKKCDNKFYCLVELNSGITIYRDKPAISEIIPCKEISTL